MRTRAYSSGGAGGSAGAEPPSRQYGAQAPIIAPQARHHPYLRFLLPGAIFPALSPQKRRRRGGVAPSAEPCVFAVRGSTCLRFLLPAALLLTLAWWAAPCFVADPLPALEARAPARILCDGRGTPLYAERGWDAQWRFPVPLARISPHAVRATLIAEDANFYAHHGVDYRAAARALWQNVTSLRVVSGASTLSMQVAALACGHSRSLWGKFLQAARARKMERLHPKDAILAAYLNHAPYGGKLHGIEAAARHYFGLPAADLTFAEATLLCGLPQRPNAFRPDRHPAAARLRHDRLLAMMVRRGALTQAEADRCRRSAPIRLRDFTQPSDFARLAAPNEHLHALRAGYPFDAALQTRVLHLLRRHRDALPGVRDAACVVLPRAPAAAPLVYLGTLDFASPHAGQVDAARAWRSAGSILKPFIFAEAIDAGLIVPDTLLSDAPLRLRDYAPTNYDGATHGAVTAATALADSLNLPAIRLLAQLGDQRFADRLATLGLTPRRDEGLTLALGTGGASPLALARAYAALPRVHSPATEALLAHCLRRPLPNCVLDVAWKTGTANNNTDAWCLAWTPDLIAVVWFGNKDGRPAEALVGLTAAAPALGEILTLLYAHRPPPLWPPLPAHAPLCAATGLAPGPHCPRTTPRPVHPEIPLRRCATCAPAALPPTAPPLTILSPAANVYRGAAVTLPLRANTPSATWLLDGRPLPAAANTITLTPGQHTLHATAPDGRTATATLVVLGE